MTHQTRPSPWPGQMYKICKHAKYVSVPEDHDHSCTPLQWQSQLFLSLSITAVCVGSLHKKDQWFSSKQIGRGVTVSQHKARIVNKLGIWHTAKSIAIPGMNAKQICCVHCTTVEHSDNTGTQHQPGYYT